MCEKYFQKTRVDRNVIEYTIKMVKYIKKRQKRNIPIKKLNILVNDLNVESQLY